MTTNTPLPSIKFPISRILLFEEIWHQGAFPYLRKGQAFFNFMDLHKCTQDRDYLDKLYNVDDETASKMIEVMIDYTN